jgi:SAM-dependent methyltransferase
MIDQSLDKKYHTLFEHTKKIWENHSSQEPYYSLINNPQYLFNNLNEDNKRAFFESGSMDVSLINLIFERTGLDIHSIITCLEYGCGIGRTTFCLSKIFRYIYGVDICDFYIQLAKQHSEDNNINNIQYSSLNNLFDLETLCNVDLIYSVLVLQHNPPPITKLIIEKFCQLLNPNGIAIFQLPTYNHTYSFNFKHYIDHLNLYTTIDMHIVPQKEVLDIIYNNQCRIIEISKDFWTGRSDDLSQTFVIQKLSF